MNPDDLEYEFVKERRMFHLRIILWIFAAIVCLTIWYYIGYYAYKGCELIKQNDKIEFRHTPTLLK